LLDLSLAEASSALVCRQLLVTSAVPVKPPGCEGSGASASVAPSLLAEPIAVNYTNVQPTGESDSVGPGLVYVEFQNTSNVNATQVVFELDVNGATVSRFNDIGTFAPGVTIKHGFLNTSADPNAQVNVVKVKLADGSAWVPPSVPAEDN
jgi:hypothetical protein